MEHRWENRPVLFLVLATAAIAVGTLVTMALPFVWVNAQADRIPGVVPYTALELEGRDVYVREGCNNCHTQTVRPLVAEVERYGPYSRSGEFVYDRPFLWGSRRAGPDLARVGGKYPDSWHLRHLEDPKALVPASNMPGYAFLRDRSLDPAYIRRKMDALGFPYAEADIQGLAGRTEMDAMVAYLQKLGRDIGWRAASAAEAPAPGENPFAGDPGAIAEGEALYAAHCASCHGDDLGGDIGPGLAGMGYEDADLFSVLWKGIPDGGMPGFASLGAERVWKLVTFLGTR
jgi:cytochrome c oxidase cbb3-type subunit 2